MNKPNIEEINILKSTYENRHGIVLTFEQAQKIYQFESDLNAEGIDMFSFWEQIECEQTIMKTILTPDQYTIYDNRLLLKLQNHEKSLAEIDTTYSLNLDYQNELLDYYKNQFHPSIIQSSAWSQLFNVLNELQKIDFLQVEYADFLRYQRKKILNDHFRHSRIFQPTNLKTKFIENSALHLFPNYTLLEMHLDRDSRVASNSLIEKLQASLIPESALTSIQEILRKKTEFLEQTLKKYYPSGITGWHTELKYSEEKEKQNQLMSLLLIRNDRYGLEDNSYI